MKSTNTPVKTLRDEFAASALVALLQWANPWSDSDYEMCVAEAYVIADMMLKRRDQN